MSFDDNGRGKWERSTMRPSLPSYIHAIVIFAVLSVTAVPFMLLPHSARLIVLGSCFVVAIFLAVRKMVAQKQDKPPRVYLDLVMIAFSIAAIVLMALQVSLEKSGNPEVPVSVGAPLPHAVAA